MDKNHTQYQVDTQGSSAARTRVEASEISTPTYITLMTVYLGFAAYGAYEVAVFLLRA